MHWENHESATWSDGGVTRIENWQACMTHMFQSVFDRAKGRNARICTCADARPQLKCIEMLHACTDIRSRQDWIEHAIDGKTYRSLPGIVGEFSRWTDAPSPVATLSKSGDHVAGVLGRVPAMPVTTTASPNVV